MSEIAADDWYGENTATFGDRLAGARESMGLSQAEFARKLGVAERTITAWEDDRSEPRANRLQMMAGMLNVSIRWLMAGVGEGIDGLPPSSETAVNMRAALDELAAMRAKTLEMASDMGQLEKKLRKLMRENAV